MIEGELGVKRTSVCWFTPQTASTARSGWLKQGGGNPILASQIGPLFTAFTDTLAGNSIGSRAAGMQTSTPLWNAGVISSGPSHTLPHLKKPFQNNPETKFCL